MKDQYTCDINDFEKYAILRELVAASNLVLIVVWMLTARDPRKHGLKLDYLTQPERYRHLDPELFDVLARILATGSRSTRAIERSGILGPARFVRDELDGTIASRVAMVRSWRRRVKAVGSVISFFDPDNGLVCRGVSKDSPGSQAYLCDDELAEAFAASQALVAFQHRLRYTRESILVQTALARAQAACDPDLLLALHNGRVAHLILAKAGVASAVQAAATTIARRSQGQLRLTIGGAGSGRASEDGRCARALRIGARGGARTATT